MAWTREQIAQRAAKELKDGFYVNLGIGIPTLAASFVPPGREVIFHSENGILGMGPKPEPGKEDPYMVDAGKNLTTLVAGGCFVHHADAFLMIRGGHLDVSLLGAFEVSETGDLANWTTEDPAFPPGVGGAMDLAVGARAIRVIMEHTSKKGEPRILKTCAYPLTAAACVKRIYTNLAVIDVTPQGLVVLEMIPGMTLEKRGSSRTSSKVMPRVSLSRMAGLLEAGDRDESRIMASYRRVGKWAMGFTLNRGSSRIPFATALHRNKDRSSARGERSTEANP
jgi:3-oxoadipate CoA-transferase beta subunit